MKAHRPTCTQIFANISINAHFSPPAALGLSLPSLPPPLLLPLLSLSVSLSPGAVTYPNDVIVAAVPHGVDGLARGIKALSAFVAIWSDLGGRV